MSEPEPATVYCPGCGISQLELALLYGAEPFNNFITRTGGRRLCFNCWLDALSSPYSRPDVKEDPL